MMLTMRPMDNYGAWTNKAEKVYLSMQKRKRD
ncbi:MAG: hypothetical protein LBJ10_12085 [Clostridiales bacterium]|nr:hypothetical protein [Clostridiales bacterium]